MAEELPPVVTKLTGDVEPLARAFAEAEALAEGYGKTVGDKMEKGGKDSGQRGGKALIDEFERAIGRKDPLNEFKTKVDQQFKKAGKGGVESFAGEFDRAMKDELGGSGRFGRVVGDFEKVGSNSGKGLFGSLMGWAKSINFVGWGKDLGVDFTKGWMRGIASVFDNPVTIGISIPFIVAGVSEALAGAGGLLTAGLGLTGITAGVVAGFKDPAIHEAIVDLGHDAMDTLKTATGSMLDPLGAAIDRLDQFIVNEGPQFAKVYEPLAGFIVPLEQGIEGFVTRVLPGLQHGMERAGPLVDTLAREAPEIGAAVGDFLDKLTASQGGNISGLTAILDLTDAAIRGTGNLIEFGSHVYAAYVDINHAIGDLADNTIGALFREIGKIPVIGEPFKLAGDGIHDTRVEADKLYDSMHHTGGGTDQMVNSTRRLTDALKAQKDALDQATDDWDKWFGVSIKVDEANLTLNQDTLALTDSIKQNGHDWDLSTKAGQANYGALLQAIHGAHDYRQALIDSGVSSAQANAIYQQTIDRLLKVAGNAGLSAQQVQYLRAQVGDLSGALNSLDGKVVHYSIIGSGGNPGSFPQGLSGGGMVRDGVVHAAAGLLPASSPGTLVLAGEPGTRGEWMIPRAGISQERAALLVGGAARDHGLALTGGGGDTVVNIRFQIGDAEFYEQVVLPGKKKFDKNYGTAT